jgi:hypothetical protein
MRHVLQDWLLWADWTCGGCCCELTGHVVVMYMYFVMHMYLTVSWSMDQPGSGGWWWGRVALGQAGEQNRVEGVKRKAK